MSDVRGRRFLLLVTLAALAAVALAASGVAAQEHHGDWAVNEYTRIRSETLIVDGTLSIGLSGTLYLEDCTLWLTRGTPGSTRIDVSGGTLVLSGSTIVSEGPGVLSVGGRLELSGDSEVQYLDILVRNTASMAVRNGDLRLMGNPGSPGVLTVDGTLMVHTSSVELWYYYIISQGTVTFSSSRLSASVDFVDGHPGFTEKVRLNRGTVSLVASTFVDLWNGIYSSAELEVRGCQFTRSRTTLSAPYWQHELIAMIDGSTLDASDLLLAIERDRTVSLSLDVSVTGCDLVESRVELMLEDHFEGDLFLSDLNISSYADTAVIIQGNGFEGRLVLEGLDIDGPFGVFVSGDFAGMELRDSTVRAQRTAVEFTTEATAMHASLTNVTVFGETGLRVRNTILTVTDTDLTSAGTPIMGLDGSSTTLLDCVLDQDDATLTVAPGEKAAHLNVERRMVIGNVGWDIGVPIEAGQVKLRTPHPLGTPGPRTWDIGDEEYPSVRTLEWTMEDDGEETRLEFEEVLPEIVLQNHVFKALGIDPRTEGPYDLVFHDDAVPHIGIDPDVTLRVTRPYLQLFGTFYDIGTGLGSMAWSLETATGEEVGTGSMYKLTGDRWNVTIPLSGNMQVVWVKAVDRTGNVERIPTRSIYVDVPAPTLTVVQPQGGWVTNDPVVQVSGRAEAYASEVVVHVVGAEGTVTAQVIRGTFDVYFELPNEGFNQLVVESLDPFDGSDPKFINIYLDTVAPLLEFNGIHMDAVNYVTTPSLIIDGRTDDARATITIDGQQVGVMGDMTFATTVQLTEGRQTVQAKAVDLAGNIKIQNVVMVLDTRPPVLTLVRPGSNPFWSQLGSVEVEVQANEPIRRYIGDMVYDLEDEDRIIETVYLFHYKPTEVEFYVTDRAGNAASLRLVMHLDTEAPVMEVLAPRSGTILNTNLVEVVVTTSEGGCTLSADGGPLEVIRSHRDQLVARLYLGTGQGEREVTLTLTDRAGNTDSEALVLDVDTIPPGIGFTGLADGARVTTEPLTVRGHTEPEVKVVYVNDVIAIVSPDGSFRATIELVEGWQEVSVYVVDRAGNDKEESVRIKALASPDYDVPVEALAGGTILLVIAGLIGSTEAGRWSILLIILPLYTKLRKDKILDQRTRGLIQGYITANPGCNYTIIRDNLDLADGTLTYHLQVLEREGFIYSLREGLFRCFYPQGLPPPKRGKLHLSDTQMDIIRICKRIPGITVGEIASAMSRRPNVISYHLRLLREGGLVRMEEDGRHVRVFPVESAVAMI